MRLLLAALLLATGTLLGLASPAAAADEGLGVTLRIDSLTPLAPGPKDTLRVTGRIINRGTVDLTRTQVGLHIGRSISSRSELHALRAQPVRSLQAVQKVVGDGLLPPGGQLTFSLSIPIDQLSLISPGVYPMQVVAVGDRDEVATELASVATFLPYIPATGPAATRATSTPTPLAWLVPLTAPPTLLADGSLASGGASSTGNPLLTDVAAKGRLRGLLDAVTAPGVRATATIDPAEVRSLALAANGSFQVSTPGSATQTTRPVDLAARDWLDDLRGASGLELIGLPYADPDVEALLRHGHQPMADAARTRGEEVLRSGIGSSAAVNLTSGIAVPPGGHVEATGAAYYATAVGASPKAETLVLAPDSVPATGDNPSAAAQIPGVSERVLLSDDVLTQLVTKGPGSDPRLAVQEIVAELAEAHLEDTLTSSPSGRSPQPLLIAPADGWNPSASWLRALLTDTARLPWLDQVPVSGLSAATPEPRAALQYPASARAAELPGYVVDASAQIITATDGLFRTPRKGDPAEPRSPQSIIQPIQDSALEAVSSSFRGSPAGPVTEQTFLDSAHSVFTALQQQVRVVASPQVTLTSKSGRVPVTIENNLQAAVDVSLELQSLDKSRASSGATVTRTVRAGQKVQVEVEVHATSAGTFPVRLALFTPTGQTLGAPAQVLVRSTAYGIVATVFTVAALSLLGIAVLWRTARSFMRRTRRGTEPPAARSAGGV